LNSPAIEPAQPEYKKVELPDGKVQVRVTARTVKEARTRLMQAKKRHPQMDVEAAFASIAEQRTWFNEVLHMGCNVASPAIFSAAYTMLALFSAHRLGFVPPPWRPFIEALDPDALVSPPDTFNFYHDAPWLRGGEDKVAHKLVLAAEGGVLFGYVELFGVVCVGAVLSREYPASVGQTYGYDLIERRLIEDLRIDKATLCGLPLAEQPVEEVAAATVRRFEWLLPIATRRHHEADRNRVIGEIINNVLGRCMGEEVTEQAIAEIAYRVARDYALPRMQVRRRAEGTDWAR
jgi:hypothetical protein